MIGKINAVSESAKAITSYELSSKFNMLINVKMQTLTIVSILALISRINTVSESFEAKTINIFKKLGFNDHMKFHAQLS